MIRGRVSTELLHVGEQHSLRLVSELCLQSASLRFGDSDQDWLALGRRVAHERRSRGEELVLSGIEERLVAECVVGVTRIELNPSPGRRVAR